MSPTKFLVRFKSPDLPSQLVIAERAEFHGDHLVFVNSQNELVALFVMEIVESWSEFE